MKIIKHGQKQLSEPQFYFKCPQCGCEFKVTQTELRYMQQSLVYTPNCECPECNYFITYGEKIYE